MIDIQVSVMELPPVAGHAYPKACRACMASHGATLGKSSFWTDVGCL